MRHEKNELKARRKRGSCQGSQVLNRRLVQDVQIPYLLKGAHTGVMKENGINHKGRLLLLFRHILLEEATPF